MVRLLRTKTDSELAALLPLLVWLLTLLLLSYFAFLTWPFFTDDAYITLRYSQNLSNGYGIVWNPHESTPVEGYSNFLYVLVGALFELGLPDPVVAFKVFNWGAFLGLLVVTYRLTLRLVPPYLAVLVPFFLVLYRGQIWWTASGLETPFFQLIVFTSFLLFTANIADRKEGSSQTNVLAPFPLLASSFCVFIAALTRPEGPLVGMALALGLGHRLLLIRRENRLLTASGWLTTSIKSAVYLALPFFLFYGLYLTWKLHHFGAILPNSVLCKANYAGDSFTLIYDFLLLAFPIILLCLLGLRPPFSPMHTMLLALVGLYVIVLYDVDPIIGYYNRHFLTAYTALLILAVDSLHRLLSQARAPSQARFLLVVVIIFGALLAHSYWGISVEMTRESRMYSKRMQNRREIAEIIQRDLPPDSVVAVGDAGAIPYWSGAKILDLYCLNTREYTSPPISSDKQKFIDWTLEQQPDLILLVSSDPKRLDGKGILSTEIFAERRFRESYTTDPVLVKGTFEYYYWFFFRNDRAPAAYTRIEETPS